MPVNTQDLTWGVGDLYSAPVGTTEPLDTAVGTAPGVAFVAVGSTVDGLTLNAAVEWELVEVDQTTEIVARIPTREEYMLETQLAEVTLENLALAMNSGDISTGSGFRALEPGVGDPTLNPEYRFLLLDGRAPGSEEPGTAPRRRVLVRKALSTEGAEMETKKDGLTVLSVTFSAHKVPNKRPIRIIDEVEVAP